MYMFFLNFKSFCKQRHQILCALCHLSDRISRAGRGVLLDQTVRGDRQTMTAEIPVAESLELPVEFAKLTSGRGNMATTFSHYAPCPAGFVAERERIGTNPLDRAKYILEKRNALSS